MGAAMLAAYGCGWFPTLAACAETFVARGGVFRPRREFADHYARLYGIYRRIYANTREMNDALSEFRA
jgi:xylulokinase